MREVDLPDGPGSPVVRASAACLPSVLGTPFAGLPPTGDEPLAQALWIWKSWLAGRDVGLVPIADPRAFQWAGYWIAVVEGSDSPIQAMRMLRGAYRRRRLTVPTLVVFGRRDRPYTEQLIGRICSNPQRYADQVEFAYVDDAAHFITDDAPAAVAHLVIDWFQRAA